MKDAGGFQIVLRGKTVFVRSDGKELSFVFRAGFAAMAGDGEQHDVVSLFRAFLLVGIARAVHQLRSGQHLEVGLMRPFFSGNVGELESGDLQRFVLEPVGYLLPGLARDRGLAENFGRKDAHIVDMKAEQKVQVEGHITTEQVLKDNEDTIREFINRTTNNDD